MKEFHSKYLDCDPSRDKKKNVSSLMKNLFHIKPHNFEDKINPDIAGNMTQSIIDSTAILELKDTDKTQAPSGSLRGKSANTR
jgi:hypothetical protein